MFTFVVFNSNPNIHLFFFDNVSKKYKIINSVTRIKTKKHTHTRADIGNSNICYFVKVKIEF